MKTITKIEDKTDYNKIDKNIRYYIQRINKFDFVKTALSCQGHFFKKPKTSFVYYIDLKNDAMTGRYFMSQIKNPYIVLKFNHKYDRDTLFRILIAGRRNIYNIYTKPRLTLYIITPRNEESVINFSRFSIIVSKIEREFISICFFVGTSNQEFRFENKIIFNKAIKRFREKLFMIVISMLEFIEKLRKD